MGDERCDGEIKTRFVPTEDRIQITFNFGQHPFLSSTHDDKD